MSSTNERQAPSDTSGDQQCKAVPLDEDDGVYGEQMVIYDVGNEEAWVRSDTTAEDWDIGE